MRVVLASERRHRAGRHVNLADAVSSRFGYKDSRSIWSDIDSPGAIELCIRADAISAASVVGGSSQCGNDLCGHHHLVHLVTGEVGHKDNRAVGRRGHPFRLVELDGPPPGASSDGCDSCGGHIDTAKPAGAMVDDEGDARVIHEADR
jgi:hypothetical protein